MKKDKTFQPFDWTLYGMLIRKKRLDLGFRKAEEFCESIWRRTRVKISTVTLYKFERGDQIPDAQQFMALSLALTGQLIDEQVIELCASVDWKNIAADTYPETWRIENSEAAWEKATGVSNPEKISNSENGKPSPELISAVSAELVDDDVALFSEEVDQKWSKGIEAYYIENYGPDPEDWITE